VTRRSRHLVLGLLAALTLILAACSSGGTGSGATVSGELNDNAGTGTYQGFGLTPAQPRPSFNLTDTNGQPFSFGTATAGHPTFLYFGYTHCPDVCPTTMADIGLALKAVPAALRAQARVVFVTTDIADDTGPVIAAWLKAFDVPGAAPMIGLYGSQAQIDQAQAAAHVTLASDGGQTHAATVLLYGTDNFARVSYEQSDNESDAMTHDLPLVAK
jgi:protein SCO1/2